MPTTNATIDIDLTNPVNAIRALVGDVDVCNPLMSSMMYQQIFDANNINSRDECVVVWFSSIQSSQILMAHYAPTGQRYRERVNSVERENYGSERYKNYQNLVKWLRNNPPLNCELGGTLFHFGGTYNRFDSIFTLKFINRCLLAYWGCIWKDGFFLRCDFNGLASPGCNTFRNLGPPPGQFGGC